MDSSYLRSLAEGSVQGDVPIFDAAQRRYLPGLASGALNLSVTRNLASNAEGVENVAANTTFNEVVPVPAGANQVLIYRAHVGSIEDDGGQPPPPGGVNNISVVLVRDNIGGLTRAIELNTEANSMGGGFSVDTLLDGKGVFSLRFISPTNNPAVFVWRWTLSPLVAAGFVIP